METIPGISNPTILHCLHYENEKSLYFYLLEHIPKIAEESLNDYLQLTKVLCFHEIENKP